MNIEALEALVKKQEISGREIDDDDTSVSNTSATKEVSSTTSSKYPWLDEFMSLISGKIDTSSSLSKSASGLDFTRTTSGWRSGSCSFLTGLSSSSSNPHSVTGLYSNLKSFQNDTGNSYSSTKGDLKVTLENQLTEAKNKLAKLEAEKQAKEIELNSGYDSSTGKKLNKKSKEELQNKINSYESQIIMQKTTISNIEAKLDRVKE